ncbi:hypothetical protein PGT21_002790 [Puccinia graminis f. sp. tritici]|uniref:Uncharacterized protein n=1 Tax=Puccinia graminis f. sp. tritici TaxID=56615 RepID=A0A5B0LPN9_PUCGR|nr:hypothetical protein PGT21_002790 [Puccinia graminis f. sp. tritici]KAA1079969.1 hypothetical protein PGTUg99_014950 [Puccinia graminis f. sp. tritici]
MFLKDWAQRSYIIYAVIMMMNLLPSVQLLESPERSLVRRRLGHEPEQVCDKEFSFNTNLGHSKCTTKKGEVYVCDYSDCPGKGKPRFRFVDCLPIDETTHLPNPTAGKMNIYPYEYSTVDYFENYQFIQAVDKRGRFFACPQVKNTEYLTCTYCLKSASTPTPL